MGLGVKFERTNKMARKTPKNQKIFFLHSDRACMSMIGTHANLGAGYDTGEI